LEPDEDKGFNPDYMDFVSPTIAVSFIAVIFLLCWPEQSLQFVENQFKTGHLRWMVTGLTLAGSISAFFTSKRSFIAILVDTVLSAAMCVLLVLRFAASYSVDPAAYFRAGKVEVFAYFYFVVIASLLVPSVCLAVFERLFARYFQPAEDPAKRKPAPA
jgi:hypothetical protein